MITHTHMTVDSVKKNRKQQREDAKRRLFESLDRKAQAYFGLVEHSNLSMRALGMHQFLLSKQGSKTHAFTSMREMRNRFQCSHDTVNAVLEELLKALPEVIEVVRSKGRRRNSYKLKRFNEWPLHVCERLWFNVPTGGTFNVPEGGTKPTKSVPTGGTLHGISDGVSNYGDSKVVENTEKIVDLWAEVAPLTAQG